MEAETFLSSGFGIRRSIEEKNAGWRRLGDLAEVWMPGRLKGIQVSPEVGTPFLTATQVFDHRPVPRKWLAIAKTADAKRRFVRSGQILVTCSGTVGRATVACSFHEDILVSHDILRVDPRAAGQEGWIYAFLRSNHARLMATSSHYGHIIKHLEPAHLDLLPVPDITAEEAANFDRMLQKVIKLREKAHRVTAQAEARFEKAVGSIKVTDWGENGFVRSAFSSILRGRRRLEAFVHNPGAARVRDHLAKNGRGFSSILAAGYDVWLPSRFRRIEAGSGRFLLSSAGLTSVNPVLTKRISSAAIGDPFGGRVSCGWLLLARSGQNYGIIGTAILGSKMHEDFIVSDHVMRMRPTEECSLPTGYLLTALTHRELGRPLVKALAYGSSIPEIDVSDIEALEVVRLEPEVEMEIDISARAAADARSEAEFVEQDMARRADELIDRFIQAM